MNKRIIVVLDDDPTGIQTVHDVPMITELDESSIEEAFIKEYPLFYVLTNSRSFSKKQTIKYHKEITNVLIGKSKKYNKELVIVSRSDSTLRGHYPTETETIYKELINSGMHIDGEVLCPYLHGIRKTERDIHYVLSDQKWIPVGETEFAKDPTFGFQSSDLKEYVEEKTKGKFSAASCVSIEPQDKRILEKLNNVSGFKKIIINATCMEDLKYLVKGIEKSTSTFIFRCSASLVKELGHIEDRPYLTYKECTDNGHGGLLLVGSHVQKTNEQLKFLKEHDPNLYWVEFDQKKILEGTIQEEIKRCADLVNKNLEADHHVVLTTCRKRIDVKNGSREDQLALAINISFAFTGILQHLAVRPRFLITKGGITSSHSLTHGLHIKKTIILGQIDENIGVVKCLDENRWKGLPIVIFPGNVGKKDTIFKVLRKLR